MVTETHWSVSVVQDADGTSVECGCGWSDRLAATWKASQSSAWRAQLQKEHVAAARARWRRHECAGRPLEVSS